MASKIPRFHFFTGNRNSTNFCLYTWYRHSNADDGTIPVGSNGNIPGDSVCTTWETSGRGTLFQRMQRLHISHFLIKSIKLLVSESYYAITNSLAIVDSTLCHCRSSFSWQKTSTTTLCFSTSPVSVCHLSNN